MKPKARLTRDRKAVEFVAAMRRRGRGQALAFSSFEDLNAGLGSAQAASTNISTKALRRNKGV